MKGKIYLSVAIVIFLFQGSPIYGQGSPKRIVFEKSSWSKILEKAKKQHKAIFLDFFATWCAPCKEMEQKVFVSDSVANYVNRHFISVKVQLDSTVNDSNWIKNWRGIAKRMQRQYNIIALPTFLFFSFDGKIVHKSIGLKNVSDFLKLVRDATDTSKQYYTLITKFKEGRLNENLMPSLAMSATKYGDNENSFMIAKAYVKHLGTIPYSDFYNIANLKFINSFTEAVSSKDKIFKFYYNHSAEVDSLMQLPGCALDLVKKVIAREEIDPELHTAIGLDRYPNWEMLQTGITTLYNSKISQSIILDAKIDWFYKRDWELYCKYLLERTKTVMCEGNNIQNWYYFDKVAWKAFLYSNDSVKLNTALSIVEQIIPYTPKDFLMTIVVDTKANLLYKLGRTDEAIKIEKEVVESDPKSEILRETLENMIKHQPTWINRKE